MRIRTAALAMAFAVATLPASAQGNRPAGAGETIQSLAANLAALTSRVEKLEAGRVDARDLVGTYAVHILGVELLANPARVGMETFVGTITLNADGSVTSAGTDGRCALQQASTWFVTCNQQSGSETGAAWSLQNGSLVIVGQDGSDFGAQIAAGGRIMLFGGTVSEQAGTGFSNIGIAIRLPNP